MSPRELNFFPHARHRYSIFSDIPIIIRGCYTKGFTTLLGLNIFYMPNDARTQTGDPWNSFTTNAQAFVESTKQFVQEGVNPGGYYKAVWCRDASYILRDWFLSGRLGDVMHELLFVWSHQVAADGEKIIYGRGSPEMRYVSQVAGLEIHKKFEGALPSTIFHGFSEIYGQNPDIDSTALMIYTTAWVFNMCFESGMAMHLSPSSSSSAHGEGELKMSSVVSAPSIVLEYVLPRMLKAVSYLASRDIDGDGLLEQGHNEDWMDTVLRSGKIVYSQACWILALAQLSSLLVRLEKEEEAQRVASMALKTIIAVEQRLWSEKDGIYLDIVQQDGKESRGLTQDVALYLVALTESATLRVLNSNNHSKSKKEEEAHNKKITRQKFEDRANRSLNTLKARIWKDGWPLVTEAALERTGPWVLDPNQYHNHTCWPWTTGIELLARSRLQQIAECSTLLSTLSSRDSQSNTRAFYEWVNPVTNTGSGAHPFRTGISAIRIAIADILGQMDGKSNPLIV
jgi:glycogen debranching enzyme